MSDYGFTHQGKVFTPNGTKVLEDEKQARNEQIRQEQLKEWMARPERFTAYVKEPEVGSEVILWLGDVIGKVTWCKNQEKCKANGEPYTMTYVSVRGTNGVGYYGRYNSSDSQAINLTRAFSGGKND